MVQNLEVHGADVTCGGTEAGDAETSSDDQESAGAIFFRGGPGSVQVGCQRIDEPKEEENLSGRPQPPLSAASSTCSCKWERREVEGTCGFLGASTQRHLVREKFEREKTGQRALLLYVTLSLIHITTGGSKSASPTFSHVLPSSLPLPRPSLIALN